MKRSTAVLSCLPLLLADGCFRTTYKNLVPAARLESVDPTRASLREPYSSWKHYFLWGLAPGERVINTEQVCGGANRVEAVHTEQTFLQALIGLFASYYVNIYSPWTARVDCVAARSQS